MVCNNQTFVLGSTHGVRWLLTIYPRLPFNFPCVMCCYFDFVFCLFLFRKPIFRKPIITVINSLILIHAKLNPSNDRYDLKQQ